MKSRFVLSLLVLALAAIPTLSHADSTQWEVIHVYALTEGRRVAVAVPAEWQELVDARALGTRSALRFVDASGAEVAVPVAALEQASARKRVFRPQLAEKLALSARAPR